MEAAGFHPVVREWFARRFGEPTAVQRAAWPVVAAGEHVLVTAPTGSGKTLTGFLWALDRLLSGAWEGGGTRVLYVSPMKALNADIEQNLRLPLAELAAAFEAAGLDVPSVRVGLRSGDTPQAERARMLRRPPEILITTPESLNLLLLAKRAESVFSGLRTVILDEIHAVAGDKRGVHLITAVDRLVRIAGEFQRVAISATVRPLERVARFVGGARLLRGAGGAARYEPRTVRVVEARSEKRYELAVRFPFPATTEALERREGEEFWRTLAEDVRERISEVGSTIVFTNSRRLAEKLTRLVNEAAGRELAWSHHGSLARELRTAVEQRLREGRLPAIVATSSLELGIDVGALDRVILIQSPRSLASTAQRVGRAGHGVGEVSRALLVPTHPRDFLDAAVALRAVLDGEIEPLRLVRAPLDLLAQTILAIVAGERWALDELYDFVRTSDPYRELTRTQFDLVVEMLAGRYAEARIEELRPRVAVDRLSGTIEGRPGTARLLARAGGTIPDRGYFKLRLEESRAQLGELDEEFVWERSVGDAFVLGAQAWRIRAITANEVLVAPARGGAMLAPFWRADARDRGAFFSERVAELLERAENELEGGSFEAELVERRGFEPGAAAELVRLLREQRAALGTPLPHRHHLVVEECGERGADASRRQVVLYTFWGGSLNRPLSLALAALWEEREGEPIEVVADDDAVLLILPEGADARSLLAALDPERLEELLRRRLEASGFFGAHFRHNAQRALLLPRASPSRRTPLWISRQNSKRLLDAVAELDDFPLVLETWRSCLQDEFELGELRDRLRELASGDIRVSIVRSERPSPFAANLVWRRTNEQMYEDDVPTTRRTSSLRGDLLREVALGGHERPRIPTALAERYRRTAQRLLPGYPPVEPGELLEWVKERLWIPAGEWRELLEAIDAELRRAGREESATQVVDGVADRLVLLHPDTGTEAVAALETALLVREVPALREAFRGGRSLDPSIDPESTVDLLLEGSPPAPGAEGATEPQPRPDGSSPSSGNGEAAGDGGGTDAEISRSSDPFVGGLSSFLATWLRFGGPVRVGSLEEVFDLPSAAVAAALSELARRERVVLGAFSEGVDADEVVALSSLETLLRWRRAAARPELEPIPLDKLPLLVAVQQGLVERGEGIEGLQRALEHLFGFPAPAALWEREILPARLDPYLPAWLDALAEESELGWLGCGPKRSTFAFRSDFDLFSDGLDAARESQSDPLRAELLDLLGRSPRGLDLAELAETIDRGSGEVSTALWRLAWEGLATADSIRVLRQGAASGFRPLSPRAGGGTDPERSRVGRRSAFRRWVASRPIGGRWRLVPPAAEPGRLGEEERQRERVRVLLDRFGVLFRELLSAELPALSWGRLARTLRAMELSGELVAGHFVAGVPGLQFAAPAIVPRLREGLPESALWWHNAADPASLCGVDLPGLKSQLPRRVATTRVVWIGSRIALVVRRSGRDLDFRVPPGAPGLETLLEPLRIALTRAVAPERGLAVERICGEPADRSPYRTAFAGFAVARDPSGLRLRKRFA